MAGVADRLGLTALVEELTGERLHIVASNGSVVIRHAPMEVVHEVTFDASEAVRTVLDHVPGAAVAVEEHGVGYRVNRLFPPGELDGEMIICDLEDMISTEVSRVIIRDPDSTSEDFVNLARKLGLHGTNYFIGWTAWLDLAPEGVTKASGLQLVCDKLGVAGADVLAIGDGRNDIELLRWAGRGVAMGQAPESVKAVADDVVAAVTEDGAAEELRRWFG
jgi:hydroxymethylpyrimidine pyrophosphatase-like HAD family hydrolase